MAIDIDKSLKASLAVALRIKANASQETSPVIIFEKTLEHLPSLSSDIQEASYELIVNAVKEVVPEMWQQEETAMRSDLTDTINEERAEIIDDDGYVEEVPVAEEVEQRLKDYKTQSSIFTDVYEAIQDTPALDAIVHKLLGQLLQTQPLTRINFHTIGECKNLLEVWTLNGWDSITEPARIDQVIVDLIKKALNRPDLARLIKEREQLRVTHDAIHDRAKDLVVSTKEQKEAEAKHIVFNRVLKEISGQAGPSMVDEQFVEQVNARMEEKPQKEAIQREYTRLVNTLGNGSRNRKVDDALEAWATYKVIDKLEKELLFNLLSNPDKRNEILIDSVFREPVHQRIEQEIDAIIRLYESPPSTNAADMFIDARTNLLIIDAIKNFFLEDSLPHTPQDTKDYFNALFEKMYQQVQLPLKKSGIYMKMSLRN